MEDLEVLKNYFEQQEEIAFAFLFGSRSKGQPRAVSDYDIAVYFRPMDPRKIEFEEGKKYPAADKIWGELDSLLKKEVDLLILNNASVSAAANIVTRATPIVIKDKNLFLKFFLIVTDWAVHQRELVADYYKIFQRAQSLTEEDQKNIRKIVSFLEKQIEAYNKFRQVSWIQYQENDDMQRNIERWIEIIMNAIIDSSKILLSSNKMIVPETYREMVMDLKLLRIFNEQDIERLSGWVKLRNILAHEYLDLKWEQIKDFIQGSEPTVQSFTEELKNFLQ